MVVELVMVLVIIVIVAPSGSIKEFSFGIRYIIGIRSWLMAVGGGGGGGGVGKECVCYILLLPAFPNQSKKLKPVSDGYSLMFP